MLYLKTNQKPQDIGQPLKWNVPLYTIMHLLSYCLCLLIFSGNFYFSFLIPCGVKHVLKVKVVLIQPGLSSKNAK